MSFPHSAGTSVRDRPDLPQLFSGDEHLGQPLQLCSFFLHGVPDPVHLSAKTRRHKPGGGFVAKQTGTHKDIILHYYKYYKNVLCVKICCFQCDKYQERKATVEKQRHASIHGVVVSGHKQCTGILPYPANTMESEERSLSIIPLMDEEEIYSIPGNKSNNCSQSARSHSPACRHLHLGRSTLNPSKRSCICMHTYTRIH